MSLSQRFGHCAEEFSLGCFNTSEPFAEVHIARNIGTHEVLPFSDAWKLSDWLHANHAGYTTLRDGSTCACARFEEPYYIVYL